MIDLHCHMLPGIDDGAHSLDMALKMAQMAVDDGITMTACTPHIYPGLFENTAEGINSACRKFQQDLDNAGIPLKLTYGADIQIVPDLVEGLSSGRLPTLHGSHYFLFEPPHHVAPPRMLDLVYDALASGYVPIITHPERLTYIDEEYSTFVEAARMGAWLQLTGGSLLGGFGGRVQKITERFLKGGMSHLLASDAHNLKNRTPQLREARDAAALLVGEEEATRLVQDRPLAVINNTAPGNVIQPPALNPDTQHVPANQSRERSGWIRRLFKG
jgi:protein-tyrosine phosphatase